MELLALEGSIFEVVPASHFILPIELVTWQDPWIPTWISSKQTHETGHGEVTLHATQLNFSEPTLHFCPDTVSIFWHWTTAGAFFCLLRPFYSAP
jgi:hypothetical protein